MLFLNLSHPLISSIHPSIYPFSSSISSVMLESLKQDQGYLFLIMGVLYYLKKNMIFILKDKHYQLSQDVNQQMK